MRRKHGVSAAHNSVVLLRRTYITGPGRLVQHRHVLHVITVQLYKAVQCSFSLWPDVQDMSRNKRHLNENRGQDQHQCGPRCPKHAQHSMYAHQFLPVQYHAMRSCRHVQTRMCKRQSLWHTRQRHAAASLYVEPKLLTAQLRVPASS